MFDQITPDQIVTLRFTGSTQGLAMRARYVGETNGVHTLTGVGMLSDVRISAAQDGDRWVLSSGRTLLEVTPTDTTN